MANNKKNVAIAILFNPLFEFNQSIVASNTNNDRLTRVGLHLTRLSSQLID